MKIVSMLTYTATTVLATARLYDSAGVFLEAAEGWAFGVNDPFAKERALSSAYNKLELEKGIARDASEWEVVVP